jgi:O-antigen ligase
MVGARLSRSPESMSKRGVALPATAAVLLALLAPALGGGTSAMAVAVLMGGIVLVVLALPGRRLRAGYLIGAGVVAVATLDWVWPARWNQLPWRALLGEEGFPLFSYTSPDPEVSLAAWCVLLGGLAWAVWCAGIAWTNASRRAVCETLAGGIGVIALVAIVERNGHVPGWPVGTGLGPFANRNQTAMLFAIGAFLTVACGAGKLRGLSGWGARIAFALAWLGMLAVYTTALALDRSRAGPLLFAGMTLVWVVMAVPAGTRRVAPVAAGVAVALLLGTVFLLTGQSVISRLAGTQVADFRLKIFSDALRMIRASPWTGTGLGTFDMIFPIYRKASILQERVIHPESDWLWLAAETGLAGLLAVAGMLAWMGVQAWRGLARTEERAVRLIVCVACLGFFAHSFVDVPGHRLGTMMPALLLLGMAAGGEGQESRRLGWVLRGAVVVAMMVAYLLPSATPTVLDWRLCALAAGGEAKSGQFAEAFRDFRKARFLEPDYAGLPYDEGITWLGVAPRFAIEPWREALRRMPWDGRAELYQKMLAHAYPQHPELHTALAELGTGDARMELDYLGWATPEEFRGKLGQLLSVDPGLTRFDAAQLQALFPLWMSKGDAPGLAQMMPLHAGWVAAGYRTLAEYDAASGNTAGALALMQRYLPPPRIPQPPAISHEDAANRFAEDHGDFAAGLALYDETVAAGHGDDALQILQGLSQQPGCPAYVHYLQGVLLAKMGRTQEAWQALRDCTP